MAWQEWSDQHRYIDWAALVSPETEFVVVRVVARNEPELKLRIQDVRSRAEQEIPVATFIARYRRQP